MAGVRMGFAAETIDPPEISGITVTPSTSITGLSSRQVVFGSPTGGVAQISRFQVDSTQNFIIMGGGSSAPLNILHISSTSTGPGVYPLRIEGSGDANSTATYSAIQLSGTLNLADQAALAELRAVVDSTVAGDRGVGFAVAVSRQASSQTERFRIGSSGTLDFVPAAGAFRVNSSGHVGIGTTAPTDPLHVTGSVRICSAANSTFSVFGVAGTTRASSYTVNAVTTNRVLPSTQSTVAAAVVSTAQYVALVNAFNDLLGYVKTVTQDFAGYGWLST